MVEVEITLQIATKKNLKQIAKIYTEEFSKEPYNEPWTTEIAKAKLKKFRKYTDIWKIEKDKEIIGFIIINTNWWFPYQTIFIEEFAIKKEHQNRGIGKKILKTISTIYQNKNYKQITTISKRISNAYKFYEKLGFEESIEDAFIQTNLKDIS